MFWRSENRFADKNMRHSILEHLPIQFDRKWL
jgi:hypothetical protein